MSFKCSAGILLLYYKQIATIITKTTKDSIAALPKQVHAATKNIFWEDTAQKKVQTHSEAYY